MSSSGNLKGIALNNGGEIVEDHDYLLIVKEGSDTVERSGPKGGKAEGLPIEQEVTVNLYDGTNGEAKLVSSEKKDIPQYPDRKLKSATLEKDEEPVDEQEEDIPSIKEEIEMSPSKSKYVTIESTDIETRVEFEDVFRDPDSNQASIVYDPNKPCSLPMKGRKVRILTDDLPPFSAIYEGTDFEIPRGGGLRIRLLSVCDD